MRVQAEGWAFGDTVEVIETFEKLATMGFFSEGDLVRPHTRRLHMRSLLQLLVL